MTRSRPGRPGSPRIGRIEQALNREFRESGSLELGKAGRGALRALARQLDVAESRGDLDASAKLGRVYVDALQAAGLLGAAREAIDPFTAFVAGLSAPTLGNAPES